VGQETINRLDVRGQARKGLAGLRLASAPPDGAEVLAEGAVIGVISSPVASPLLGGAALAVVRKPWDEGGAEVVVRHEGQEWPARLVAAPAGLVGSG
jgi:glycine cleavage system aminomethyltransferase T